MSIIFFLHKFFNSHEVVNILNAYSCLSMSAFYASTTKPKARVVLTVHIYLFVLLYRQNY